MRRCLFNYLLRMDYSFLRESKDYVVFNYCTKMCLLSFFPCLTSLKCQLNGVINEKFFRCKKSSFLHMELTLILRGFLLEGEENLNICLFNRLSKSKPNERYVL